MRTELSVVIPVFRSAEIVPQLCRELKDALAFSSRFEIVLVNDASPDGSWAAIRVEAARDPRVVGIDLRANVGQDRSIMAGLNHARGRWIVIMDDDLQHDPADIPRLYAKAQRGYDACYATYTRKRHTRLQAFGSWLAGRVAEVVLRKPRALYLSPFKIIRCEVVEEMIRYRGPFPYVDGLLLRTTGSISQVPVVHRARHSGRSAHTFRTRAEVFLTLATQFSLLPLRAVGAFGLLCSLLGLALGAGALVAGAELGGWRTLALFQLCLGGAVLIGLGVLGEYLGRVLVSLDGAPQFSVAERLNHAGADAEERPDPPLAGAERPAPARRSLDFRL